MISKVVILILLASVGVVSSIRSPQIVVGGTIGCSRRRGKVLAAVLPGSPMVTGTLAQGVANAISIYSNVLLARFALSWFPQLPKQFPILRPVFTVTEPYLKVFRSQIPPIGGFDISAIPALFCLDILSQAAVAIGADIPSNLREKLQTFKIRSEKDRQEFVNAVIQARRLKA